MKSLFLALLVMLVFAGHANAQAATPETQIWFGLFGGTAPVQAKNLDTFFFQPDAPWPESLNHVQVISAAVGTLNRFSDDQLAKFVARLDQHHVALAVDVLAQNWVHEPECGSGVEGYSDPPGNQKFIARLQKAQAKVVYIGMDEPFFFGHYYSGKNFCHSSIDNVAERVSIILRDYQKAFPGVNIIDIEPFPAVSSNATWQQDYQDWMQAFNKAVGQPITKLFIDINWGDKLWPGQLPSVVQFARGVQLPVGIIYWAAPPAPPGGAVTNDLWLQSAVQNFVTIEKGMGIVPDCAFFTSWSPFPDRSITEGNNLGEDYLVEQYQLMKAGRL